MHIQSILIHLGCFADVISSLKQFRLNKRTRSVAELSVDYISLRVLSTLCNLISAFLYTTTPILQQYSNRFPLREAPVVSFGIAFLDLTLLIINSGILLQLRLYRTTMTQYQGVSGLFLLIIVCLFGFLGWLCHSAVTSTVIGAYNALDVTDCIWLIGRITGTLALIPQWMINEFSCSKGRFPRHWRLLQTVAVVMIALGKIFDSTLWWKVPVNTPTWSQVAITALALAGIWLQRYLYNGIRYSEWIEKKKEEEEAEANNKMV